MKTKKTYQIILLVVLCVVCNCAGRFLTDRFSPGYGDLPLSLQADFLRATDAGRKLGITVNDSFLMTPCKTVTAVIGLSERPQPARVRGCAHCNLRESCRLRQKGESCAV